MSEVFHAGDYHFFHKNIHKMRPYLGATCEEEHREMIIDAHNKVIGKRDLIFLHGDIVFEANDYAISQIKRLNGMKHLILGNHDVHKRELFDCFHSISSLVKYKGKFWLSHAPLHTQELRGKMNIHGHTHGYNMAFDGDAGTRPDYRYFNVSLENIEYKPISHETLLLTIASRT